ncbi:hypothetical protein [Kamptonema sp. UHCC 0994]|uniref:hypothetical protein n=1 Tax=Kamptonema sp. UHCC 0994 TaxID=3031329 RepID=UPI0023B939C6|nr:hypothetical protein [Kamptonema sp. UHCC 0994]MDF0551821.1 hypothetical protein [Kamptonema sp. UHCC 0994]
MKQQLQQRLQQLKAEYESGKKVLAELEAKQANVRDTLLRIAGAIQVLEEELAQVESEPLSEYPLYPKTPTIEVSPPPEIED